MELSDLYSSKIIEIAARLPITDPLVAPDCASKKSSKVCGSTIKVELKIELGKVSAYSHEVNACALGQTSASIMCEHIIGANIVELQVLRETMFNMLKNDGDVPTGRFSDLKYLQSVKDYPARHTSTMLVFDAVVDCIEKLDKV